MRKDFPCVGKWAKEGMKLACCFLLLTGGASVVDLECT